MSAFEPNQGRSQSAPAGWYPVDEHSQRYWDGARWTDHVAPGPGPTPWHPQDSGGVSGPAGSTPFGQPAAAPTPADPRAGYPGAATPGHNSHINPYADPYGDWRGDRAPMAFGHGWDVRPVSADERSMATLIHVLGLVSGFVGPLVLWLVKRDESAFIDAHGKEALNFHLSFMLYWFVTFLLFLVVIGFLLMPVLFVLQFVFPIIAAVTANRGQPYRYPMVIRFFS